MKLLFSLCSLIILSGGPALADDPHAIDSQSTAEARVEVPEPTPQAAAFHRSGNLIWAGLKAWGVIVPFLAFATGASAWLRSRVERCAPNGWIAGAVYLSLCILIYSIVSFPLDWYVGYHRLHAYGISNQPFAAWLADELKELGLAIGLTVPLLLGAYAAVRRFPRRWWLACGAATFPIAFVLTLVAPVWIDPLFNDFRPMQDKALEARIVALAGRAGIDVDRVFEVDMSRKTKAVNAYVTGLGGTKRIVLWDTLLARLTPDEVLVVMGHEMGHYVLGHVVQGVLVTSGLITLGLWLLSITGRRVMAWMRRWSKVDRLDDYASLPLLGSLALFLYLFIAPIGYAYSRHAEHEADRFALELTRDNRAAASAFVGLQRENLGFPRPGWFFMLMRSTHPSLGERIEFCNEYRPWEQGKPLRYGGLVNRSVAR